MRDELAKIPTNAFEFALWHLMLRQDAESDPNLSPEARAIMEEQFGILDRAIRTLDRLRAEGLLQVQADDTLQVMAEGFSAALRIGAYYPDAPRTPPTRAANKKRMRVPHTRRRGDNLQQIIERHARKLGPELRENPSSTARNIYSAVASEVESMQNPPNWWKPRAAKRILGPEALEDTKQYLRAEAADETKERRIENIRRRISRKIRPDE